MSDCTKEKGCKATTHWEACPERPSRMNDDATYNRSNLSIDQALALGWYEYLPRGGADPMG